MNSHRSSSRRSLSALLTTTSTGGLMRRSQSATAASSSVTPTEPSTTNSTTIGPLHGLLDLAADLGVEVGAARQPAAGVDQQERPAEPLGLHLPCGRG